MEILILLAAWFIVGSKTIGNVVRDGRLASSGQMPPRYQLQMERLKASTGDPREAGRIIRKRGAFGSYVATVANDAWTDLLAGHQREEREYRARQAAKEQAKATGRYEPTARERYVDAVRDNWRDRKDRAFDRLAERRRRKNEARRQNRETQPAQPDRRDSANPEDDLPEVTEAERNEPGSSAPAVLHRDSPYVLDEEDRPNKTDQNPGAADPATGQNQPANGQNAPQNAEPALAETKEPTSGPVPQNGAERDGANGDALDQPTPDAGESAEPKPDTGAEAGAEEPEQTAPQNEAAEQTEGGDTGGPAVPEPPQVNGTTTNNQQPLGGDALMGANTQNVNGEVHSQQSAAQLAGAWAASFADISNRLEQAMAALQANGVENTSGFVVAMEHANAAAAALTERAETLQSKGQVVTEAFAQGGGDVGDNRDWHRQN